MTQGASRHPSEETMAAFVEGALTPGETSAMADHLRECDDCRVMAADISQFEEEEVADQPAEDGRTFAPPGFQLPRPVSTRVEEPSRKATWRRWSLQIAAAIVLPVIVLLVVARPSDPRSDIIDAAPKEHRRVDARVSGFPWAPLQAQQRGGSDADPKDLKLGGAAGEVLDRTATKSDPRSLHARGVAFLVIDYLSESITELERAAGPSKDARTWNDLAAARYALVEREERLSQLPLALAAADRALVLDPELEEAHFNRALILQRMGLLEQARKAWDSYLALDPSSEWSVEARARLRSLGGKPVTDFRRALDELAPDVLVRQFPQESRTWGEGILLAEWADAEHAGDDAQATAKLGRIRGIGNALAASSRKARGGP